MRFGWAFSRWPAVERWLRPCLALFFVAAGGAKLLGMPEDGELFRQLGYAPWFMWLTGAVQLLSGLGLLLSASAAVAAAILAASLAGAAGSLLSSGDPWMLPVPLGLLLLLLAVGWHNAPVWLRQHHAPSAGLEGGDRPGMGNGFLPGGPGLPGNAALSSLAPGGPGQQNQGRSYKPWADQ